MTVYDAQPIEKLYSDGFSIGNLMRGIYWKYGSIYISLTNICTFLYNSPYYGRSLQIRIMWHVNMFLILLSFY
jgi:hypothetical protein